MDAAPLRPTLQIGPITADPPVVLAPMAGVTDAPFRVLCASFGGGLYVNQMVTARALLHDNKASWELARFHPAERVRSLQLYGTDPVTVGEIVRRLVAEDRVDHVDMNFGCPAAKVTRNGGGAALPVKRTLLRSVVGAAVRAADAESGGRVPVTIKFRVGIDDDHLTFLDTGRIAADEGVAAVALHARTALQHYAPPARWERIAELVEAVPGLPVLGNGDVFAGEDAVRMMTQTGCAGVVVGRGCLGRPWLFRDLEDALAGRPVQPAPPLGEVANVIRRHLDLALEWRQGSVAHDDLSDRYVVPAFRKHLAWYLKGYPVGAEVRRAAGQIGTTDDVHALLDGLDPDAQAVVAAESVVRSHSSALKRVALPEGWLDNPDEDVALDPALEEMFSGG